MSTLTNGHAASFAASDPFAEQPLAPGRDASGDTEAPAMPDSDGGFVVSTPSVAGGGGASSRFMAMPQLLGAPAYARPPRIVAESPRPLDPDDLPIEALRSAEDEALLSSAHQRPSDDAQAMLQPSSQGGLRAVASRLFGSGT